MPDAKAFLIDYVALVEKHAGEDSEAQARLAYLPLARLLRHVMQSDDLDPDDVWQTAKEIEE